MIFLGSREDFEKPFKNGEFRIVNDPNGICDLYDSLYHNFSINKTANAFYEFNRFIKDILRSRYNTKHKIYDKNLYLFKEEFLKKITKISYNGSPRFFG